MPASLEDMHPWNPFSDMPHSISNNELRLERHVGIDSGYSNVNWYEGRQPEDWVEFLDASKLVRLYAFLADMSNRWLPVEFATTVEMIARNTGAHDLASFMSKPIGTDVARVSDGVTCLRRHIRALLIQLLGQLPPEVQLFDFKEEPEPKRFSMEFGHRVDLVTQKCVVCDTRLSDIRIDRNDVPCVKGQTISVPCVKGQTISLAEITIKPTIPTIALAELTADMARCYEEEGRAARAADAKNFMSLIQDLCRRNPAFQTKVDELVTAELLGREEIRYKRATMEYNQPPLPNPFFPCKPPEERAWSAEQIQRMEESIAAQRLDEAKQEDEGSYMTRPKML
jgi:hypothetical protein